MIPPERIARRDPSWTARLKWVSTLVAVPAILVGLLLLTPAGCGDDDLFIRGTIPRPTLPPATPSTTPDPDDEDEED